MLLFVGNKEIWEQPGIAREVLPRLMRRFALQGREADLLFLSGDPLDPTTRIERVMARGEFISGEEPGDVP